MDDVTDQLLREGVEAFLVPMEKLLAGIESKREAIVTGRPTDDRVGRSRTSSSRASPSA